jgi:hypothetical protein
MMDQYTWCRRVNKGEPYFEVSTAGDKRFSALNAKLQDGRTIEEAYQLDIKGYRTISQNWKDGKGKPPLNYDAIPQVSRSGSELLHERLYDAYFLLWKKWAEENPELIQELSELSTGKTITDCFANTPVSQARALCDILNNRLKPTFKF